MQVLWAQGWREWHGADPSQLTKKPRDKSLSHFLGTSRKREFMDPKQQIPSKSSSPLSLPGWFEIFWIYLTLLDGIFSWFFHGMSGSWVWEANVCLCITWSSQERIPWNLDRKLEGSRLCFQGFQGVLGPGIGMGTRQGRSRARGGFGCGVFRDNRAWKRPGMGQESTAGGRVGSKESKGLSQPCSSME